MTGLTLNIDTRRVARVTLDRPERHNAFDEALIAALTAAFRSLPDVRAVILTGNGKSFCAGADLDWMKRAATWTETENAADAMRLSDMLAAIDACPAPVIAVAHGSVFGGGVGLVACADLVVATPDAKFRLSEVRLGLTPATISPFVVAAIGARQARRYAITAEIFGAEDARRIGLVHEVTDAPDEQVAHWLNALLECAPGAVADAKRLVADVSGRPIDDDLRAETARRIAARRASAEGREGVAAFLDKRPPNWMNIDA
jgi:methylglutaconyl-CoA hydratase